MGKNGKAKEIAQTEEATQQGAPTETTTSSAPAEPEMESAAGAPASPPRPSPAETPLQPLPPAHPSSKGQDRKQPEIFPISYYDPQEALALDPEPVPYSHKWHITKLVLGTASLVFSAVIVGLGVAIGSWGGTWSIQEAEFAITCSTAGLAIVWTTAEVVTICVSKTRDGIHPGAHVGLHLIIWLMTVFALSVIAIHLSFGEYDYYYDVRLWPTEIIMLERALLAFISLLLLIHFVLFVRACVETHQVNTTNKINRSRIIRYVQVPVPVGVNAPYYPGPPEGGFPHPYPQAAMMRQPMVYTQPQSNGPVPPQQTVLYGGYYAPAGPPAGAPAHPQPSASTLLHGYYEPPPGQNMAPERRASNSQQYSR